MSPIRRKPRRSKEELAAARRLLRLLGDGADVRTAKVQRIKSSVEAGTFENALKHEIAFERMLRELAVSTGDGGSRGASRA